jgi:hypothetical protein
MRALRVPAETVFTTVSGGAMDVLSTSDGSAQAVRDAAAMPDAIDSRLSLERELDRLNHALAVHAGAAAQHANWTLLTQAFLLTSYLIVLVGGWNVPLPGKRWLLMLIAGYGAVSLVLGYLAQRGSRERLAPLRQGRRVVEQALERVAGRPPLFSRDRWLAAAAGEWAARLLPLAVLAGWGALALYTLALPLQADPRTAAARDTRAAAATAVSPAATAPRKSTVRKGDEPVSTTAAAPTAAEQPAGDGESGLAGMLRRALNAPAPEPQEDAVKP